MARDREFNPAEALQSAIRVFWERGYGDTSVDALVNDFFTELTGVMRACLVRAADAGEIAGSADIDVLATCLVTEFQAAPMLAASGHSRGRERSPPEIRAARARVDSLD